MQLSPIDSPRKLDKPGTINIFGSTSNHTNNAPSGSLFTNNSLFSNNNQSSSNSLFSSSNTMNTPMFGTTPTTGGLFGQQQSGNSLFPSVQNSNSLGVPQTNLFSNQTFQLGVGINKPVFSMGKK